MDWKTSDWYGLYRERWGDDIVPDAYAHPAKYARGLIRAIYAHLLDQGYIQRGDTVLDPFAGVALGALDAMRQGLRWWGNELEEKFVKLGRQNLDLWDRNYRPLWPDTWGSAVLTQGDSRELGRFMVQWADGTVSGAISSPPYATGCAHTGGETRMTSGQGGLIRFVDYGETEGQLSTMPEGDLEAVVSSPPYSRRTVHGQAGIDMDKLRGNTTGSGSQIYTQDQYGDSPGQLGRMPEGDLSAVVSSPPYARIVGQGETVDEGKIMAREKRHLERHPELVGKRPGWTGYGATEGQLGRMPEGDLDAAISSPPYNLPMSQDHSGRGGGQRGHTPSETGAFARYGNTPGQIEGLPMTEEGLQAVVSSPPFGEGETRDRAPVQDGSVSDCITRAYTQDKQGTTPGNLATMKAVVSSPPYAETVNAQGHGIDWEKVDRTNPNTGNRKRGEGSKHAQTLNDQLAYSNDPANLGTNAPDDFWTAARQIVDQCYLLLKPGAVAVWVVKRFVRDKRIVDFPDQWRRMCEAAGFETVEWIRAWVVEEHGSQADLFGNSHPIKKERKSFFRRLYESKYPENSIDWEDVLIMKKKEAPC